MDSVAIARALGISPRSTLAYSYFGNARTIESIAGWWYWEKLHPEMRRRHLAMYFSHPGTDLVGMDGGGLPVLATTMGPGSAAREAGQAAIDNFWSRWSRTYIEGRPSRNTPEGRAWLKPGYAPIAYPGSSNHEVDTFEGYCMAVDGVGWQDGWQHDHAWRFGLKTFHNVGSEPWHTQPDQYPNSKSALQRELAQRGLAPANLPAIPLARQPEPEPEPEPETDWKADEMAYLQLPPADKGNIDGVDLPWFICGDQGQRGIATATDAERLSRTEDRKQERGGANAWLRYELLHESVLGRKP